MKINEHSVSQNSKTEHKLNDIMDEVLGQHSVGTHTPTMNTPTTVTTRRLSNRSSNRSNINMKSQQTQLAHNINNILSPPSKSGHYVANTTSMASIVPPAGNIIDPQESHSNGTVSTDAQTATNSMIQNNNRARESTSNHRPFTTTTNGSIPRNDSIPIPNMRVFGKTQKKSPSPSPSEFDGRSQNVQQIENIIIPRMNMAIGQSVRSPAFKEDDTKTDLNRITDHDTTSGTGNTNLNKYVTDDEDIIGLSGYHGLINGQLTPTIGSKRSQDTGVTSFHPDGNINNHQLLVHDVIDSREIPIQLTPYDLDEDQKGNPTYSAQVTPTPNTHTNTNQNFDINDINTSAIKRMMENGIDLNDRSTDGYNTVHKDIRMEMQDSTSYQSSILPLPDDVSGTQHTLLTLRGKEHNEHESISFGNHDVMIHGMGGLKDRYPHTKTGRNNYNSSARTSVASTTMQTGFSDSNGKHNGIDLIREISDTNTLDESKENSYHDRVKMMHNNNNHDYLYDTDDNDNKANNSSTSNITITNTSIAIGRNKGHHHRNKFTAEDEDEDSLDIGSVMTNTTNNRLRNDESIVPYSEQGSFQNMHQLITSPSIIKDTINPSKMNAPYASSVIPNFTNNGNRSFQSDGSFQTE